MHEDFRLFATQNPSLFKGKREVLSNSFLSRFVTLVFEDLSKEGEMLKVMYQIGGFRTLQDMIRESERRGGLNQNALDKITEVIKSCGNT